jgi:hypothetical protein
MKSILSLFIVFCISCIGITQECFAKDGAMALIHGRVTDFTGTSIKDADVELKNNKFVTLYSTKSDLNGNYSLAVDSGRYLALFACKDYGVKNLEYWAWNITADSDIEINPRFQGLEVYAVNAFPIQRSPAVMEIYFRPMSLKRTQMAGGKEKLKDMEFIDIAPKLKKADIQVAINGESVAVLALDHVKEYVSSKQKIAAYLIQTDLPEIQNKKIWRICVTLHDAETKEWGEGCVFLEKPVYK